MLFELMVRICLRRPNEQLVPTCENDSASAAVAGEAIRAGRHRDLTHDATQQNFARRMVPMLFSTRPCARCLSDRLIDRHSRGSQITDTDQIIASRRRAKRSGWLCPAQLAIQPKPSCPARLQDHDASAVHRNAGPARLSGRIRLAASGGHSDSQSP
jgi:hypothetical protein